MFRMFLSVIVFSVVAFANPYFADAAQAGSGRPSSAKATFTGTLNINTASADDFVALPGIGAKTAALIVEYRQKNGPFKKIEDLMNIRGIGEKNFLKLKPQINVAPPKGDKGERP